MSNDEPRSGRMPRGRTAAEAVYLALRDDIVSLARKPGSQVNEKAIALAHGVSRTPVREAILRLAGEGLIDVVSKAGTYVSRIRLSALAETIVVRKALEEVTVRAAVAHATPSQIIEMRALLTRQAEASEAGDQGAFHLADEAFHETIARAGGFPGIWALVQTVKLQVDRYRRLTLPQPGRMALVIREHKLVLDAIEARDADAAAEAMGRHIAGLDVNLAEIRRINPNHFEEDVATIQRFVA
ncbi:GntR family transcriptional regulator [Phreatobacter stygius]|uniref:GntR family transcriptional regulator n=1 Tax=Phreatobacter stygius TaxID=1940610 RepID=A0A4D7BD47_9HYPH|nr:GntR family transcriptional regulator [Phreatobacter stygius]QCI65902.1 GntR family transcriptional regulator [Phreatobacter stygius]